MMRGMTNYGPPAAVRTAMDLEEIRVRGLSLGLTSQQVSTVVDAWTKWYSATGQPVSISAIRLAIMARVTGEPCMPPPL